MPIDEHNPAGWTFATIYQHFNERFEAAKDAISKVENATEKRFESVNEFRNTLRDQQVHFADKDQTDFRLASIETRLTDIGKGMAASGGKSQGIGLVAVVITQIILVLIAIGGLAVALFRGH